MSKPIMSAEQFDALTEMVRAEAHEISQRNRGMILFPQDRQMTGTACDAARRLLVEPEQVEYDGPCAGGPLDGMALESDGDVVKRPGGEYEWGSDLKEWYWIPDDPADCVEEEEGATMSDVFPPSSLSRRSKMAQTPEFSGRCIDGPWKGKTLTGSAPTVTLMEDQTGDGSTAVYKWSDLRQAWRIFQWDESVPGAAYVPTKADPDLTTFGAIPRGQRCQALDDDPVIAGKIFRRAYDGLLRHGRNAVEEETGKLWQIGDDEPVRRLAQ